jgi:hypothetical protein
LCLISFYLINNNTASHNAMLIKKLKYVIGSVKLPEGSSAPKHKIKCVSEPLGQVRKVPKYFCQVIYTDHIVIGFQAHEERTKPRPNREMLATEYNKYQHKCIQI